MSISYAVTITMDPTTLAALTNSGSVLYVFKAVRSTMQGLPVVWLRTSEYFENTILEWREQYTAYASYSQIQAGVAVIPLSSYPINRSHTLSVTGQGGAGTVSNTGRPGAISIANRTPMIFTCGVSESQPNGGSPAPTCALPLFVESVNAITPVEKVLLMFSSLPMAAGTIVERVPSAGIFIDLTGNPRASVAFDISTGWSWDAGTSAQGIAANADLVPVLVESL